ncbi:3'-phosphoesterase [Candidatus Woesearchaeota archaeon]|nr:3'-phosphoesterase [Candidatus Woesearchaeota archaeon]
MTITSYAFMQTSFYIRNNLIFLRLPKLMPIFVVQKHDASHLHYDFRLEMDGVLKSWAIPKGPSMNPKDKRLAVETADHAKSYAKFEGTIPEGQYGAGTVKIWDKGTYKLLEKTPKEIKFVLKGKKLHGEFTLVKFRPPNNWLLIKKKE